jgi:hypothetical protein
MTEYQWEVEAEDTRRTAYRRVMHDGRPWLMATVQYFEGGKWEGRVAMVPDTPEARWSVRYNEDA